MLTIWLLMDLGVLARSDEYKEEALTGILLRNYLSEHHRLLRMRLSLEAKAELLSRTFSRAVPWAGEWIMARRSHLYEDAFASIAWMSAQDIRDMFCREGFNALFLYEEGSGPGMTNEFVAMLLFMIFAPEAGFWRVDSESEDFFPASESRPEHYRFHGRVLALALKQRIPVQVGLSSSFLERLLAPLSDAEILTSFGHFRLGFFEICDWSNVSFLSGEDLFEILRCFPAKIDVQDWKSNTTYEGYSEDDEIIDWFWTYVASLNEKQKERLLYFVTSVPCAPMNGFRGMRSEDSAAFTVVRADDVSSGLRLPSSRTCFNQLVLPQYQDFEDLRRMFDIVLEWGYIGFGTS